MSKSTTIAAIYREFGPPEEVTSLSKNWRVGELEPGSLRLRMLASPVNPADINLIQGKYGVRPKLPAVGGLEGVAEIAECGDEVTGYSPGDWVLLPPSPGAWCGELVVPAREVTPLPRGLALDPAQAAMLSINPPTAWRLLHDFVELPPGAWVIQNAANSGVGLAVAALAKVKGWRTINLARREEALEPVRNAGGDVLLLDEGELATQVEKATGGEPVQLALNCVGGESALRMANCLADGGKLITFGAMGRQPLKIPNGLLIFRDLEFKGFWLSRWRKAASRETWDGMIVEIAKLAAAGKLHSHVAATYPLEEVRSALAHAQQSQRGGKVLLRMGG